MKNVLLWSRAADGKILTRMGYISFVALAGFTGLLLPAPTEASPLVGSIISATLLVLVWAVLHLVQPRRPSHKWVVAKRIVIPTIWVLLMVAVALWFSRLHWNVPEERELIILRGA